MSNQLLRQRLNPWKEILTSNGQYAIHPGVEMIVVTERKVDFHNPDFRSQVVQQAKAVVESGVVDGVMFDWWVDDPDRLALIREVRHTIGDTALILVNANDRITPQSAPFINGYFMECTENRTPQDWTRIADTLAWAEANLRTPRINCLETWYHTSRDDLHVMRATTTLALTLSDGYCLIPFPPLAMASENVIFGGPTRSRGNC